MSFVKFVVWIICCLRCYVNSREWHVNESLMFMRHLRLIWAVKRKYSLKYLEIAKKFCIFANDKWEGSCGIPYRWYTWYRRFLKPLAYVRIYVRNNFLIFICIICICVIWTVDSSGQYFSGKPQAYVRMHVRLKYSIILLSSTVHCPPKAKPT